MPRETFEATLESSDMGASVEVPAEVMQTLSPKKRPPVKVTLNGDYTYRSTVAVYGGRFILGFRKEVREAANLRPGEAVTVELELDEEPRTVDPPMELKEAFEADSSLRDAFHRLSFTHQKEYARWIEEAKKEETRRRRAERAVEMIREGVKTPDA